MQTKVSKENDCGIDYWYKFYMCCKRNVEQHQIYYVKWASMCCVSWCVRICSVNNVAQYNIDDRKRQKLLTYK